MISGRHRSTGLDYSSWSSRSTSTRWIATCARHASTTGSRPLICTETNFIVGNRYTYSANAEGEQAQAASYATRLLGERGVTRVSCYELVNGSSQRDAAASHPENNFGVLPSRLVGQTAGERGPRSLSQDLSPPLFCSFGDA